MGQQAIHKDWRSLPAFMSIPFPARICPHATVREIKCWNTVLRQQIYICSARNALIPCAVARAEVECVIFEKST